MQFLSIFNECFLHLNRLFLRDMLKYQTIIYFSLTIYCWFWWCIIFNMLSNSILKVESALLQGQMKLSRLKLYGFLQPTIVITIVEVL